MARRKQKRNGVLWLLAVLLAACAALLLLLPDGASACVRSASEFDAPQSAEPQERSGSARAAVLRLDAGAAPEQAVEQARRLASEGDKVGEGDIAPDFTAEMFDGGSVTLSSLRGKVVLLNFWATWCGPCMRELACVQRDIIDRFAGEDFVFLAVSRGDTRGQIAETRRQRGFAFPMAMDPGQTIFAMYAEKGIPRNYLIDREGRIVRVEVGYSPASFAGLADAVAAEIARKQ